MGDARLLSRQQFFERVWADGHSLEQRHSAQLRLSLGPACSGHIGPEAVTINPLACAYRSEGVFVFAVERPHAHYPVILDGNNRDALNAAGKALISLRRVNRSLRHFSSSQGTTDADTLSAAALPTACFDRELTRTWS